MNLTITKERILETAKKFPESKDALKSKRKGESMLRNLFVVLSVVTLLLVSGCQESTYKDVHKRYEIVVLDECEYIVWRSDGHNSGGNFSQYLIVHKGNCSNPVHKK
jgi:hypothetical protein